MWLNVGCGTHRAPPPWHNIDTTKLVDSSLPRKDWVEPDQVIDPNEPLPFADSSCDRVFLGHVLEHIPWEAVPGFLLDIRRIASHEVLLVGPDVYRCIDSYKRGIEPLSTLQSCLEHKDYPDDMLAWPGAPHHWNCHEARVIEALNRTGWHAVPVLDQKILNDWPVVGYTDRWQFAVMAVSDGRACTR